MEEQQQPDQPEQYSMDHPLFETQRYSYKSKRLPGKPAVLNAGDNLTGQLQSGVDFTFGSLAK